MEIVVESNDIPENIMTNDKSNSWADKRSKIIGNYIAGEMLMNKNQKEFIIDVFYSKSARNNNLTADNNLTDNQKETIYKETFSLIKDILLKKFTKKQVDSILKYESEKLSLPKEKNNVSTISSLQNESFLVGSTLIHRELSSNYANLFLKDFKYLTAMNAAKQANINPTNGSWKWDQIDNFVEFSKNNNLLFRLHSPIGPQCSKWIKDDARTADELQASLDEFLFRLLSRYKDFENIKWIDVVNETILGSGKWLGSKPGNSKWENPWLDIGLDENGYPLYIIKAFELADNPGAEGSQSNYDYSNQLAVYDIKYDFGINDLVASFYLQEIAEDGDTSPTSPFSGYMLTFGSEIKYMVNGLMRSFIVEFTRTILDRHNSESRGRNLAYEHGTYKSGYRYRGLPIGAFIDTDSKFTQFSYLREIAENQVLKTDLFYAEPNTDAVGRNIWGSTGDPFFGLKTKYKFKYSKN